MYRKFICASVFALVAAAPAFAQDVKWTGPYVDVTVGYGGSTLHYPAEARVGTSPATVFSGEARQTSSGVIGGGGIGYNFQTGPVVLGVEADIAASDIKGEVGMEGTVNGVITGSASGAIRSRLDYLGTVRARVGLPIASDRVMPYVTGGFAFGHLTTTADGTVSGSSSTLISGSWEKKANRTGWTAGAGLEYSITPHVSFRTEYLYADLGTNRLAGGNFSLGGTPVSVTLDQKNTVNAVRAGIAYRF